MIETLKVLWDRRVLIMSIVLNSFLIALIVNFVFLRPAYQATAVVKISPVEEADFDAIDKLTRSMPVAEGAVEVFDPSFITGEERKARAARLMSLMHLETDESAGTITFIKESISPKACAEVANAYANSFVQVFMEYQEKAGYERLSDLEAKLKNIFNDILEVEKELDSAKPGSSEWNGARNRLAILHKAYSSAEEEVQQAKAAAKEERKNRKIINARVVEEAVVPQRPIRPDRERNMIVFTAVGLLIGVAAAFAINRTEKRGRP